MRYWILIVLSVVCAVWSMTAQTHFRVGWYNVENLFDCTHDSLKNDSSYIEGGRYHWNHQRYYTKLDRIAQVLVNMGGWESIPIVGLCEVENAKCLSDLCRRLKCYSYKYVHYEGPDVRGVDVALLYDSAQVKVLNSRSVGVKLGSDYTRDILYVCALYKGKDTIHNIVCHLPSQMGGTLDTEWKRERGKKVIGHIVDSVLRTDANAQLIVMGDMNSEPKNDLRRMHNMMLKMDEGEGTHKYQGTWSYLDQYYVSDALWERASVSIFSPEWLLEEDEKYLGYRPRRTYVGMRYQGGYSDHLPVLLYVK